MRILKLLKGNDSGGVFTCEVQYINHWKKKNIKVDGIIIGQGDASSEYKDILDDFYEAPENNYKYDGSIYKIISSIIQTKLYANNVIKTLRLKDEYDAIIYRRPTFIHFAGQLGKSAKTKVIWHMPCSINRFFGKIYYNIYLNKYSITPIANSIYTKNTLGSICKNVVYPGYDENRIQPTHKTYRNELNIPDEAVVFGTLSRIAHEKAQDLLIEGLINSGLLENNVHCIIGGDMQDNDYGKKLVELSRKYFSKIHFIGKINNTSKLFSSIDIYVNSRRNEEPFGISVAEAMGAGLPVIAYYKGGPSEMIKNNVNGWLINKPDIDSYSQVFLEAYRRKDKWRDMGKESRKRARIFESSYNADKLISLI